MAKTSPGQFIQEVRQETKKVTWPTRKEAGVATAMVFVMVILAAIFFFLIDQGLAALVRMLFGLEG